METRKKMKKKEEDDDIAVACPKGQQANGSVVSSRSGSSSTVACNGITTTSALTQTSIEIDSMAPTSKLNGKDASPGPGGLTGSAASGSSCCRTPLAFLFVAVMMILNLLTLSYVHERVPFYLTRPLPDIAFSILPVAYWTLDIAEYVIITNVVLVVLLLFIHRYRTVIFRRLCLMMGVLYMFRACCMISTTLPLANPNYECADPMHNRTDPDAVTNVPTGEFIKVLFSRTFHMLLGFGLSINGMHNYCGDYLYSGHTVMLTLGYLTMREYLMPLKIRSLMWKLFNLLMFLLNFGAVMCVLISHGHYLIDVLLAYYVTTRVFWIYHTLAYNSNLRYDSPTNYLSRVIWWRLFLYFENDPKGNGYKDTLNNCHYGTRNLCTCDVPIQVIPRSFEWPLPWPRWLRRRTRKYQQRLLSQQQA